MDNIAQQKIERRSESGNVLFIILLAVGLIGFLTAAIQGSNTAENSNIDKETLAIRISEVKRDVAEFERGILYIMRNGISESDIRFAHPDAHTDYGDLSADGDPTDQLFHRDGGAANYYAPPSGINDGSAWEFYGSTHIPGIGTSSRADLVAVLPNVTQAFCDRINAMNGQSGTPADTGVTATSGANAGSCVYGSAAGRFDGGQQYYATPNTMNDASFEQEASITAVRPAPQACVQCSLDSANHFYHVLLAR